MRDQTPGACCWRKIITDKNGVMKHPEIQQRSDRNTTDVGADLMMYELYFLEIKVRGLVSVMGGVAFCNSLLWVFFFLFLHF